VTIRPTVVDDAPGIADVIVESWKWAYEGVVPDDLIAQRSDKAEREAQVRNAWDPNRAYYVAVTPENRVLGFIIEGRGASLDGYDAEVAGLYVHPDAARQGIGQRLMSAMAQRFAERGAKRLCLHTLRDNRISRGFYDKAGGTPVQDGDWNGVPSVWYGWGDLNVLIPSETPSD